MIRALLRWWHEREFRRVQADLRELVDGADPRMLEDADKLVASALSTGKSYRDALFETMMTFMDRATSHAERGYEAHSDREIMVAAVLAARLRLSTEARAAR